MKGTVLEKIESLRKDKTPNEIENLLLNGKLGSVRTDANGYQYIGNVILSWLVVEIHEPGIYERIGTLSYKYVVHHIDGNPLNNIYLNLQVMKWADHIKLHKTAYYVDPANVKKHLDWYKSPDNVKAEEARGKAISKAKRNGWITPDNDPEFFENWFTRRDYAKASKIPLVTAWYRLKMLLYEGQIVCEKKLINGSWCNVYRGIM